MNRIIAGILMIGGWVALLLLGSADLFWLVLLAAGAAGLAEYYRMTVAGSARRYLAALILAGFLPLLAVRQGVVALSAAFFAAQLVIVVLTVVIFPRLENGFLFLARQAFGVFLVGFCPAHLMLIREVPHGIFWLLILTAVTASSDIGAYYSGRWLGSTKLAPALSPGKTRAGAAGGIAAGTVAALFAAFLLPPVVKPLTAGLIGLLISLVGIVGDLTESMIKRCCGVKDSGRILAGHGGILDRIDSLLFTAPLFYYLLRSGVLGAH